MKAGAYFFSIFKKNQTVPQKVVNGYALMSEDEDLMEQLQSTLSKPIEYFRDFNQMTPGFELLFDANELTFKQIISQMENMKQSGATFKIVHKNEGFLIGSNSSNDRGEVITFATRR
jgi:hypothetical protein